MKTLLDFGQEVAKIREAVNSLEVKGENNAALIVYSVQKCNEIISAINEIVAQSTQDQNDSKEADADVQDTGSFESN